MQTVSLLRGLGADMTKPTIATDLLPQIIAATQPQPGQCSADGAFIWIGATSAVPAHWERKSASQSCSSLTTIGPNIRTGQGGGVSVSPTKVMKVGEFTIPVVRSGKVYKWGLDSYDKLTPAQAEMIRVQLQKAVQDGNSYRPVKPGWIAFGTPNSNIAVESYQSGKPTGHALRTAWGPGEWLTNGGWLGKIGLKDGDTYDWRYTTTPGFDRTKGVPIAQFKHPDTGKDYGLWMDIAPVGPEIPALSAGVINLADGTEQSIPNYTQRSQMLRFMVAPIPDKSWLGDLWDWIKSGVQTIIVGFYDAVWDAAEGISDALCALTASPGALTSAAAKGGPEAAAAAQATELLLQGRCPVQNPTPDGTPGPPGDKTLIPWGPIIAGGVAVLGIIAFVLATPKKSPVKRAA